MDRFNTDDMVAAPLLQYNTNACHFYASLLTCVVCVRCPRY